MSSYINSAKHFNSIENKLQCILIWSNDNYYMPYDIKNLYPELYSKQSTAEKKENIIRGIVDTLRHLQVLCVSLQYKHHYDGVLDQEIANQTEVVMDRKESVHLSLHGLYNAMRCISYQIEREHLKELRELLPVEESALKFMEIIINSLAHHLVSAMPEDECKWSIE